MRTLRGSAVDHQIGQRHRHRRRVVPVVARHGLVVPDVLAGIGVRRRRWNVRKRLSPSPCAAPVMAPRRAVAGADVDQVGVGVVRKAVPGVAAAAVLPPLAGPGLGRHLHRLRLERLRRIAGNDVEPPRLVAGLGVVGGHVAAHAVELGAAVADDDLALDDARRAGDHVLGVAVRIVIRTHTTLPVAASRATSRPSWRPA